jgi:hypothetical protein
MIPARQASAAPCILLSHPNFSLLSRPKGRNYCGEDLAEEGGKLFRSKLNKKLF